MSPGAWHAVVDDARRFADRWHHVAIGHGWTIEQLYGLHPVAPWRNLASMGAAWLVASRRDQVIDVDRDAVTLRTRSGATLRIYRRAPQSTSPNRCR